MEDDIEMEEGEDDTSTESSDEEEKIPHEVKNNTQIKGMKRIIVNEGPSIDLGTLVARAPAIVGNVAEREVHILETEDHAIEQVDTKSVKEVPMVVTEIPIPPANEEHIEMGEGNEALEAMDLHSTLPTPTTRGVIALGLTTEPQPITMTMTWASQDQGMIEKGDGFYYN